MKSLGQKSIYISIYSWKRTSNDGNSNSQTLQERRQSGGQIPADYRFEGDEVYISRDERTGDVILSTRPGAHAWADFFDLMKTIDVPGDFMADRPMNTQPLERNIFAED